MRRYGRIIGYGIFLWMVTVSTPVWGQGVSPEAQSGERAEGEENLLGEPMGEAGEPALKRMRPKIGREPGRGQGNITPRERREKVRKRVEMIRMLRLTEELDLDEETATRLFSRLRPIEKERWTLIKERLKVQRELRKATTSEITNSGELTTLMNSMEKNKAALSMLDEKEKNVIKSLLSPRQQAKYLIFKEEFNQELKTRIRKARKGSRPHQRPGTNFDNRAPTP